MSASEDLEKPQGYMPGLDVLRGIAILMVFLYHGFSNANGTSLPSRYAFVRHLPGMFELGAMGVHLFFVLSGMLITGILLDTRTDSDRYRNFYLRRILRIVPAYVLVLFVLRCLSRIDNRYVVLCLLYLGNMPRVFHSTSQYGPLWSLSVEEQFYILWPLLVFSLSRRALAVLAGLTVLLTPALRFILLYGPPALRDIHYKTWALGDFLAAGALLALAIRTPAIRAKLLPTSIALIVTGAVSFITLELLTQRLQRSANNFLLAVTLEPWVLLFTGLTLLAYLYPNIAKPRTARALVFLGSISYGLYLVHQWVIVTVQQHWAIGKIAGHPIVESGLRFALAAAIAVAIAWLSRNTWEKYFLSLKPKRHPAATIDGIA